MDKPRKKRKTIDFDAMPKRSAAFKVAYIGLNYDGFAVQENTQNTVEAHIFDAFMKATFIKDRQSCNYSRCGRTDKGVSALGNAFSLLVRSRAGHELGEYDYVGIANKILPADIRLVSSCFPDPSFDARFSCLYREYKYFFCLEDMDFDAIQASAQKYRGEHDFRNFCKMDIVNVSNFVRRVLSVKVEKTSDSGTMTMCILTIRGFAFLWHQVRCMAAVLFLIGNHSEAPEVIDWLLDTVHNPRKPSYDLAPESSLLLYDCGFESAEFQSDSDTLNRTFEEFRSAMSRNACMYAMYSTILSHFDRTVLSSGRLLAEERTQGKHLRRQKRKIKTAYIPLMDRSKVDCYEDRVQNLKGKKAEMKAKKSR